MTKEIANKAESNIAVHSAEVMKALALAAAEQSSTEKVSMPYISIKGKKFTLGEEKLGKSISVVVLATAYENVYYDRAYDPDVVVSPACFAISPAQETMVPSKESPVIQGESCKVCIFNQFQSAPNGKGKACKNGRRLLVAAVDDDGHVDLDNPAIIKLPPTSLKNWASYVKVIASRLTLPTYAIVTDLSFDDDSDWPVLVPAYSDVIKDAQVVMDIIERQAEFIEKVQIPYDVSSYEPPAETAAAAPADTSKKSKMS